MPFATAVIAVLILTRGDLFGTKVGKVSGTVRIGGKPLQSGAIVFHPNSPRATLTGTAVEDGEYAIEELPVGGYGITVTGNGVPAKYSATTSGLTGEVLKGENVLDIELR